MNNLESYIDHTLLAPYADREMIEALCMGAREHGFKAVCVNPYWIKTATAILADCDVLVATVVGFPIGATFFSVKAEEARMAVAEGADEIDMVINIGALLSGQTTAVARDIDAVREAAGKAVLKVILETCLLNQAEIIQDDRFHAPALAFLKKFSGKLLSTWPVITEASHLLGFNVKVQVSFLEWMQRGALTLLSIERRHLERIITFMNKYADVPMDLADASIMVMAEATGVMDVFTIDADYYIYRTKSRKALNNVFRNFQNG